MKRLTIILVVLGALSAWAAMARAEEPFATIDRFPGNPYAMAPGPDGRLWLLAGQWPAGLEARADELHVVLVARPTAFEVETPLTPLADGSVAYVGRDDARDAVLIRVAPGAEPRMTPLAGAPRFGSAAIAPDGTVWIDDPCGSAVVRFRPDGHATRLPIAGENCQRRPEWDPRIAIGGDGSIWLVHLCAGQVVRFSPEGRSRRWRVPPKFDFCSADSAQIAPFSAFVEPTDEGGVRFTGGSIDRRGRYHSRPERSFQRLTSTIAPDGRRWFATADGVGGTNGGLIVGAIQTGAVVTKRLAPFFRASGMTPGPDGSVWLEAYRHAGTGIVAELLRATPIPPLGPAPTAHAGVVRALARRAGAVWIQVACTVRPGLFCNGSARVAPAGTPARFAIPGGQRQPCMLALTDAARATLRRRGTLAVIVRVDPTAPLRRVLHLRA